MIKKDYEEIGLIRREIAGRNRDVNSRRRRRYGKEIALNPLASAMRAIFAWGIILILL